jgi:hypothetical protein
MSPHSAGGQIMANTLLLAPPPPNPRIWKPIYISTDILFGWCHWIADRYRQVIKNRFGFIIFIFNFPGSNLSWRKFYSEKILIFRGKIFIQTNEAFIRSFIHSRAPSDIKSGSEVRQIFKIRTLRKPKVFLPGRWTFNTFKIEEKKSSKIFFNSNFFYIYFQILPNFVFLTPNLCPGSRDLIIWGLITDICLANLCCPFRKLICPVRLSPNCSRAGGSVALAGATGTQPY